MSRKILFCFLALALVSNANAASKMFGNWEDSNDGFMDWGSQGFYIDDPVMSGKYTYTTTGHTLNSKAVKMDAGIGWQQNLSIKSYESPYAGWPNNNIVQGFLDNQYLAVDVTFVTADWVSSSPGSEWATVEMNIQGTNLGWESMGRPDQDTGNPGYPGGWDATHFGAMQTRTMYWDIAYLHDGNLDNKEFTGTPTSGVVTLIFQTDSGGFSSGGVYYFDNVRFVPELATIVLYVDANATGANNGSSWSDAYKYLQDALTAAEPNDSIWVAEGTYRPDANTSNPGGTNDRTATFQLKNDVALYGGFPSGGGTLETRDPDVYETILSGDINVPDNNSDNSYHVVTGSGTNSTAILDGFTIIKGNADYVEEPWPYGGGMYNYSGSPTVTNCTFTDNSAIYFAGGMYNAYSSPTVINCTFSGNMAEYGGGVYDINSSPTVTNCTFSGNSGWTEGGGMYNCNSSPILTNCSFNFNHGGESGGGMLNYNNSSLTLTNCTFTGNFVNYDGGGMCNYDGNTTLTNCTFIGNSADYGWGGGMSNGGSSPNVTNCILWGNTALTGPQIYNHGTSSPVVSFSDVQGGYSGTSNINADPLFVDPNGPDNIFGTEDDNLRLSRSSPCIDAGNNNFVPHDYADLDGDGNTTEPTPLDLDLWPRFVDGDCNGMATIDMGAFEFTSAYFGDFDSDCDIDFIDFAIQANFWLTDEFLADIAPTPAGDGIVDTSDLSILCDNWLESF